MLTEKGDARRVGRPPIVTRDQIVRAALTIIERDGMHGLTMRTLSDELGASKMAAYHHVRSKSDLIDLAAKAVAAGHVFPEPNAGSWEQQLRDVAGLLRSDVRRYRGLAAYASSHEMDGNVRFIVWFEKLMRVAGFDTATATGAVTWLPAGDG